MTKIPVFVVDDEDADRYIVQRRLGKHDDFAQVMEAESGDAFLSTVLEEQGKVGSLETPLLVLMDVNMPGKNGFETIEELQTHMERGHGPKSIVIMMFTSSNSPVDREKSEALAAVKGYILKPLTDEGVDTIREIYHAEGFRS